MVPDMEELRELKKKYPDVEICTSPDCKLTVKQHEPFYDFEQKRENAKKTGEILISYVLVERDGTKHFDNPREVHSKWIDGKWVEV